MSLSPLQRQLECIYEVAVPHNIDDFVFSDATMAQVLGAMSDATNTSEQLFVHEDDDGLDVSLYLEQEVVDRLREDDPTEHLHAGNLADFLTALEGVSHFLYLTWNAHFSREVSALELELQAEVDKYVISTFLLGRQTQGHVPQTLCTQLFEASYDTRLNESMKKRYAEANYYARKFCKAMESVISAGPGKPDSSKN